MQTYIHTHTMKCPAPCAPARFCAPLRAPARPCAPLRAPERPCAPLRAPPATTATTELGNNESILKGGLMTSLLVSKFLET